MSATTSPPPTLSIDADSIPAELRERPQWVAWRWKWDTGREEWTKEPVNARTGALASSTNRRTWTDFATALAYARKHGLGVGYVFSADDPFVGVDRDKCRNRLTEELEPEAAEIVNDLNSYTELSPSETGIHIIVKAKKPGTRSRHGAIEMYDAGRYFTVTGHRLPGTPATVEARQEALSALYTKTFGMNGHTSAGAAPTSRSSFLSDDEILEKARTAKNRDKFCRLWAGDTSGHKNDHSAADQALCALLAFYTQDPNQIDRLFRESRLYREKWDEPRPGGTYGTGTIDFALNHLKEVWEPSGRLVSNSREGASAEAGPTDDTDDADDSQPNNSDQTNDTEPTDAETEQRRPSQATALVAMATAGDTEFFTDGSSEPFATFTVKDHRETAALSTKGFKHWLGKRYYDKHRNAPGAQAVQDALNVLAGKALYNGAIHTVWCRLAKQDDTLWLDLGDDAWRAVRISAEGWTVVDSKAVPVKFRRPRGLLPFPEPDPAGDLSPLADFIRRGDEDDAERILLVTGWLIGTFQMDGGRAILELLGEQGSGKTLLARLLRRIVDPNAVPLRTMPREERDLVIAAANSLIVTADNASELKAWQSDAFCRLSTGGGIGGRQLYTDLDEVVLDAQRSSLITGINAVATRGDLLDRTLSVTLPPIPATERRAEAVVWQEFEQVHAHLLGGVLHAVATALANRDRVNLARKPRLADFIEFVEAAAPALGWEAGKFLRAFEASRRNVNEVAIESLPIGPILRTFCDQRFERTDEPWKGTASALLHELVSLVDDETKRDRDWPKRGNRLSSQLRQLAPNLRQVGVLIRWERSDRAGTRNILISQKKDAADRQHRQNRQGSPENRQSDAKTQADDGWGDDRQPSSVDRQSSSADRQQRTPHAKAEADDIPHEPANFAGEVDWEPASADDTDDTDDGLPPISDNLLRDSLLDDEPGAVTLPPDCLSPAVCARLGPCPRHADGEPCQIPDGAPS